MAHSAQAAFCKNVKSLFPQYFSCRKVLDVGSLDINGNNRSLFEGCDYTGIDIAPGLNVDKVSLAHEFSAPPGSIDTIISTECFEHDMFYEKSLRNLARLLKPAGLLLFTCATTGRGEHGTVRTSTAFDSPLTARIPEWQDYYKNLTEADIRRALPVDEIFSRYRFLESQPAHDLYFWGIKNSKSSS